MQSKIYSYTWDVAARGQGERPHEGTQQQPQHSSPGIQACGNQAPKPTPNEAPPHVDAATSGSGAPKRKKASRANLPT